LTLTASHPLFSAPFSSFNVKAEAATRQEVKAREYRRRLEELSREVPQIVKYYQEQNMIALKSKGIKKAKKKQ
jgi:hypothetical protein